MPKNDRHFSALQEYGLRLAPSDASAQLITGHCQRRRRHGLSPTFRPIEVDQHDAGTEVCLLKTTHRPRQPSHPKIHRRRDFGSGQQVADFACRLDGCWSQDCKQLPLSSGTLLAEGSRRLGDRGIGAGRLSSFIGSSRGSSTAPPPTTARGLPKRAGRSRRAFRWLHKDLMFG